MRAAGAAVAGAAPAVAALWLAVATAGTGEVGEPDARAGAALSGGETTVFSDGRNAFALPLTNISRESRRAHVVGNSFFNQNWVVAPSSTSARDGLGPLFHSRSCSGCHFKDGRGEAPAGPAGELVSMLVRLSVPGDDPVAGVVPHPVYGDQLNERAVPGVTPEGRTEVRYEEVAGTFADGAPYTLRRPEYRFTWNYGDPTDGLLVSPRVAQPVFGLGLLEAVPEDAVLALADPDDADGDGISGRPNRVWDRAAGEERLGRFGWKAGQPSVRQQSAAAFLGDIGITSPLAPEENDTPVQRAEMDVRAGRSGGHPEIEEKLLDRVTTYIQTLAVPARRHTGDPEALRGEQLFVNALGCAACHTPTLRTGGETVAPLPELAHQTIHPYTDLLLHDMGEGLADGRPEFGADGREWRTPPLWGIGLTETVNGHTTFLHDGRARNLEEAILWHGGEAEGSRAAYRNLPADDRRAVLTFLGSL